MKHTFTAVIQEGRGGGAYAEIPFDVEQAFGDKRPQVKATFDSETEITRLVRMGAPCHIIGVPKAVRTKLGKAPGDSLRITVEPDATPRAVVIPPDLKKALQADRTASAAFEKLSFTHRKEYAKWVSEAKKEETRARRVAQAIEMLKAPTRRA